jgi:hypothetical protein
MAPGSTNWLKRSMKRCVGAREAVASSTSRTMRARVLSRSSTTARGVLASSSQSASTSVWKFRRMFPVPSRRLTAVSTFPAQEGQSMPWMW